VKEKQMIKNMQECEECLPPIRLGYNDTYIKLSKDRIIFITEEINKQLSSDLSALLLHYDNENDEEISLYINSPGGDVFALTNIYDVIQMIKSPIRTVCLGRCSSAAAVILAVGEKGRRAAMRNSKIMIHGMQARFPMPGQNVSSSKNLFQFMRGTNDNIMSILARHTGQEMEKVRKDCERDLYFSAKEAKDYGLIDEIIG
jgi:ATP-dependent Clp protease protease subunit